MPLLLDRSDALGYLCKYRVEHFILMMGEERLEADYSNILSIEYMNDYEKNLRAMLKVTLRVDIRKKIWIIRNKREITAKIELSKIGMDHDVEEEVLTPETAWNLDLRIYLNDDNEEADVSTLEKRLEQEGNSNSSLEETDDEDYLESQNTIDIYLFDQQNVEASNAIVNEVFTSSTLQQIVGRVLTDSKHHQVLMSRIENGTTQRELLLPAFPAYKALSYLDQYCGLYKTGALLYYDIDACYLLNTNGKVTAKRTDEWVNTTILVNHFENGTPGDGMVRIQDEKTFYISTNITEINIKRPVLFKNATNGSEASVVVTDDTQIEHTIADQSYIGKQHQRILYRRKGDNPYDASILQARMEENECVIYIYADNLDVNAFTPNKSYQVVFEDVDKQNAFGTYTFRLAYAYHMIKATSERFMSSSHVIILKRAAGSGTITE